MLCEICGSNYNLVEFENKEGETVLLCDSCFQEEAGEKKAKSLSDSLDNWDEDEESEEKDDVILELDDESDDFSEED